MGLRKNFSVYFPELGREIWHFTFLDRAMSLTEKLLEVFPYTANGRIVWADKLLQAKGRWNRKWIAEKGGLWIAISLFDEFLPENAGLFSLIFGLALKKCLEEFGFKEIKVKWINDLHYQGKKLAGVLIEKYKEWYVVGIGINVNNPLPEFLNAISLKNLLGHELKLEEILYFLIKWLSFYLGFLRFYERKLLEEVPIDNLIIRDFKLFTDTLGRWIKYGLDLENKPSEAIVGKALDIDEKGKLILRTELEIYKVSTGEIFYLE